MHLLSIDFLGEANRHIRHNASSQSPANSFVLYLSIDIMPNTHRRPMKVLCLHGLTENTSVMEHKLTPMIQHLPSNTFEFIYVSAPYVLPAVGGAAVPHGTLNLQHNAEARIQEDKEFNKACTAISYLLAAHHNIGADRERSQSDNVPEIHHLIPEYTAVLDDIDEDTRRRAEEHILFDSNTSKRWWTLPSKVDKLSPYIGQETGLAHISKAMREQGPFDGVIGFSTGAMMAAFCQSLLTNSIENSVDPSFQPPEDQTPFKFAIYFTPWLLQNGPHSRHFDALLKNTDTRTHTPALCVEGIRDRHCAKGEFY
jgi:hypothetical protein